MDYIFIYSINMLHVCTVNTKLLYFKILLIHGNEEMNYVEQFNYCCISLRYFFISDSFYLQLVLFLILNYHKVISLKCTSFSLKNVSLHNIGISNVANIHWSLPFFESKFLYLFTSNSITASETINLLVRSGKWKFH